MNIFVPTQGRREMGESMGRRFYRMAAFLFVIAVALLVWRRNDTIGFGIYALFMKPSDLLLIIALFFVLLAFIFSKAVRKEVMTNALLLRWVKYLSLFLLFLIIGSAWSSFVLHRTPVASDAGQYGRIVVLGFGFFLLTVLFGARSSSYVKMLILSFLSALIIIPAIFSPENIVMNNHLVTSPGNYTLVAFQLDNLICGSYLVFSVTILFSLFVVERGYKKLFYLTGTILLTSLVLWTGSRGAWLSTLASVLVVALISGYWRKEKRTYFIYCLYIALVFALGFLILPQLSRNTVLARIFSSQEAHAQLSDISTQDYFLTNEQRIDLSFNDSRGKIWVEHAVEGFFSPFGLGPSYVSVLRDKMTDRFLQTRAFRIGANAHNTWLQILLSAGIGGLLLFVFAVGKMAKGLLALVRSDRTVMSLWAAGGFVGILANSFFIDSLELRWFWVVFALVAAVCENKKPTATTS